MTLLTFNTTPRTAVFHLIHTVNFIAHIHKLLKCKFETAGPRFEKNQILVVTPFTFLCVKGQVS